MVPSEETYAGFTSAACREANVAEQTALRLSAGESSGSDLAPGDYDVPGYVTGLTRHFIDLRDNTHGGSQDRHEKEEHFIHAVELLDPVANQVLGEMNTHLLLESGGISGTGPRRNRDGSLNATWGLTWPEQRAAEVSPVVLIACFGSGNHHPHLRGGTVRNWPLNIFTRCDAADQLPILRAIAAADLHNLVFLADYRIVPAVARPRTHPETADRP